MADLEIIFDHRRIDFDRWSALILDSYWGKDRTAEMNRRAFENSVCLAAALDGKQLGFARAITDRAAFAYMADVLVEPEARGLGIGKALIRALLDHPDLPMVTRWSLRTADAHALYEQFGFKTVNDGFYMMRVTS
jgi:GNAT superfamily N-acetyltransferase